MPRISMDATPRPSRQPYRRKCGRERPARARPTINFQLLFTTTDTERATGVKAVGRLRPPTIVGEGGGAEWAPLRPFAASDYCGGGGGVEVAPGVIWVPITSPETIISTRRFSFLPAAVLLSATGSALPSPRAITLLMETLLSTR